MPPTRPISAAAEMAGMPPFRTSGGGPGYGQDKSFLDKHWTWICIVVLALLAGFAVWYLWKQNKENEDKWKTERIAYQQRAEDYGRNMASQLAAKRELNREMRTRKGIRGAAGAGVEPSDLAATHDWEVGVDEKVLPPGRPVRTDRWTTGANDQEIENAKFEGE